MSLINHIVPWHVNCFLTSAYGFYRNKRRWSEGYREWCRFFEKHEFSSYEELLSLQNNRLKELIGDVYEHNPYYRRIMRAAGVGPRDITCLKDLEKMPILTKDDVCSHGKEMIREGFTYRNLLRLTTGGSTGAQLQVYWSRTIENMQNAFVWTRFRKEVKQKEPSVLFTGRDLSLRNTKKPPYWVDNWVDHQRLMSVYYISEATIPNYIRALDEWAPTYLAGYQSAISLIAHFMLDNQIFLKQKIKHYFSSSEELLPSNEKAISEAFGCKVWNHYGQNELVSAITEYDCGHLHYDMDYSIIEFIPVRKENGFFLAKVVGTKIHDKVWPLIRYDTGDMVLYDPNEKCEIRNSPIIKQIYGRSGAYINLPDGRKINNITAISRHCKNFSHIQAVQNSEKELLLYILPNKLFNEYDKKRIRNAFNKIMGNTIEINIKLIGHNDLIKTKSGKIPSIINNIR